MEGESGAELLGPGAESSPWSVSPFDKARPGLCCFNDMTVENYGLPSPSIQDWKGEGEGEGGAVLAGLNRNNHSLSTRVHDC
jgi:hypothetical protein